MTAMMREYDYAIRTTRFLLLLNAKRDQQYFRVDRAIKYLVTKKTNYCEEINN